MGLERERVPSRAVRAQVPHPVLGLQPPDIDLREHKSIDPCCQTGPTPSISPL
jgi:hypothetical protein